MVLIFMIVALLGCKPYRIERHRRSPIFFNPNFVDNPQREVTLEDGTVLIFDSVLAKSSNRRQGGRKSTPFKIREELEGGEIILRALLPQHVLLNLLVCLRNEEYELVYDKLLAGQTRETYEAGEGLEGFTAYLTRHRRDMAEWLTRMIAGLPLQQVQMTRLEGNVTRCRLRPQFSSQFKFKSLDVYWENGQYKLLMIR